MNITRITTVDELEALAKPWNCLTRGIPFRSAEWLFTWWRHYGQAGELFVLAARDDQGTLIGAAPWYLERTGTSHRVIRFLGSGKVCSDYLSILASHDHEQAVVEAMAAWLCDAAHGRHGRDQVWDLLDLDGVPTCDSRMELLATRMQESGCSVNRRPGLNCWRASLRPTFAEFATCLSRSQVRQVNRVRRRVLEASSTQFLTVQDAGQLAQGMEILVDLHQRRRTSLGEPGCFVCPQFSGFLHEAAPQLLSAGLLQLSWIESAGQPIAVEFALINEDACHTYQGGLDPEAHRLAPGHALTVALLQKAIDDSRRSFDFLRGDEPYKASWGARPVATCRLRIAADRLVPRLRAGTWVAGQTMKDWIKAGVSHVR